MAHDFKALQKEWYARLRADGFEDIENQEGMLKEWDFNFFRNKFDQIKYETTLLYYSRARGLLNTFQFKNELERAIWELHCEGLSERKIASKLRKFRKSWIHVIIAEIRRKTNGTD